MSGTCLRRESRVIRGFPARQRSYHRAYIKHQVSGIRSRWLVFVSEHIDISGWILTSGPEGFIEGTVTVEDGIIQAISDRKSSDPFAEGIVLPRMVNAHTHIGDGIAMGAAGIEGRTRAELVAPPNGLKHRLLRQASPEKFEAAIRSVLSTMFFSGTAAFYDFREGGIEGVELFRSIIDRSSLGGAHEAGAAPVSGHTEVHHHVKPVLFGRPKDLAYDGQELSDLLTVADGIGVSSISDWEHSLSDLQTIADTVHAAGKPFALHVSEHKREDIGTVIDLEPDLIVHMLCATRDDLLTVAEAGIPVVVCPRSNAFYGDLPDIPLMLACGVDVRLGTDNAMLCEPSLLREMTFAYRSARLKGTCSARQIVECVFPQQGRGDARGSKKLLNRSEMFSIANGSPAEFIVLTCKVREPYFTLVNYLSPSDIELIISGESLWHRKSGGWVCRSN